MKGHSVKKNNPYTLTFGKKPAEYISRHENLQEIISTFESENAVSQTYLIEGIRGSGKTVLMTAITGELSKRSRWLTVDIVSSGNIINDLASRLIALKLNKKFTSLVKNGFNISVGGFGIGLGGGNDNLDAVSIIEEALTIIKKKEQRLLITIDEVTPSDSMRYFAGEFQSLVRKDYPVFLLMTGLYENIYAVQNDPALTFLLRTPKISLEPLSIYQITCHYAETFEIDNETAVQLAGFTKGYAFAFQALGVVYYEYRDSLPMEKILIKLDEMLDDYVYRKIWSTLSAQDKNVITAISDGSVKVKDLCEQLKMSSSTFSKYRDRLIKKGLLVSSSHGYVELALPRFGEISKTYI